MLYRYRIGLLAATIAAIFGTTACFGNVEAPRPADTPAAPLATAPIQEVAPANIGDEDDKNAGTPGVKDGLVHLPRSMIGMRLLESTEVALTGASPDIRFIKPRIVYFALYNDQLALFETNAVSPHRDLRTDHLIDTFSVLRNSPETVIFAAPQQLRGTSAALPYDVADAPLRSPLRYAEGTVLDVDHAVLEEVTLHDQTLSMRHALTVRAGKAARAVGLESPEGLVLSTRYVRTTLSPYQPSPTFAPLEIQGGEGRYFQVATVTPNTAELSFRAMHWDTHPSQPPITFGLARQMSPRVTQAVEEGLNYWNRVAGRQILARGARCGPRHLGRSQTGPRALDHLGHSPRIARRHPGRPSYGRNHCRADVSHQWFFRVRDAAVQPRGVARGARRSATGRQSRGGEQLVKELARPRAKRHLAIIGSARMRPYPRASS